MSLNSYNTVSIEKQLHISSVLHGKPMSYQSFLQAPVMNGAGNSSHNLNSIDLGFEEF